MSYHGTMTSLWHGIAPLSKANPHQLATRLKQEFGEDLPVAALEWHAEQVRAGETDKRLGQMHFNDAFKFLRRQCQAQRDLRGTEAARVASAIEVDEACACRSGWLYVPGRRQKIWQVPCLQCAAGQRDYWLMRGLYDKNPFRSKVHDVDAVG